VFRLIGGFADLMGTEFRGQAAALAWAKEWTETLDARAEIETIRQVNNQVMTILHIAATGSTSGVGTNLRVGQVYSFRDGRISALDGTTGRMTPSKPSGWSGRRCPRTLTSCARSAHLGSAATSARPSGRTESPG
jgi:hypothetical protein